MSGRPLRVGLVGYGWVNQTVWRPRLERRTDFRVTAVYDPAGTADADAAAVPTLRALLRSRPDVVVVGAPNRLHAELTCAALDAGALVLVEKPACLSGAELRLMAERARRGNGMLVSRPAPRRHDVHAVRRLASLALRGPLHVTARWLRANGVPRPGSWFSRRSEAGGGALLDLGWHLADLALGILCRSPLTGVRALLGPPVDGSARSAAWRLDPAAPERGPAPEEAVETRGELRAEFADGSRLCLEAAWVSEVRYDTTAITVVGEGGRVELVTTFGFSPNRVPAPTLTVLGDGWEHRRDAATVPGHEYDRQLDVLAAAMRGAVLWERELARSTAVLELLESAYRSGGRPLRPDRGEGVPHG